MKLKHLYIFLFILFLKSNIYAQQTNLELQEMADADQEARKATNIDWNKLNKEDELRRERTMLFMKQGKVNTAKDYFNAGIIFQHGNDTIASALAVQSFKTALELDINLNRWWYPAAVDRNLMRRGLPQIYGTQFIKDQSTNNKWQRYKIDESVITDEERSFYGVETLADQEAKERLMNQKNIADFYAQTNSINETLKEIKKQFKEGSLSPQNVTEDTINKFAYYLVANNKLDDACKIAKLNTELYPNTYNAFDSYAEILMQSGEKKKAIKAYKKSLKLNPKNEKTKLILSGYN